MDILFVLIPLSVVLVLLILALLWWSIYTGQLEDLEGEGERILHED
jgi:cbb3-type cytochrome oxidase maturation protein